MRKRHIAHVTGLIHETWVCPTGEWLIIIFPIKLALLVGIDHEDHIYRNTQTVDAQRSGRNLSRTLDNTCKGVIILWTPERRTKKYQQKVPCSNQTWQWKISIHGGFNGNIYAWWSFHCQIWCRRVSAMITILINWIVFGNSGLIHTAPTYCVCPPSQPFSWPRSGF